MNIERLFGRIGGESKAPATAQTAPGYGRSNKETDMSDANRLDAGVNTHVLYRFYSVKGTLLYVGITNDPENRFRGHRGDKPWWRQVSEIKMERFQSRGDLAKAEIEAIQDEKPKYNKSYSVVSLPETLKVDRHSRGHATPVWSDASRFGNVQPEDESPVRLPRLRVHYPCLECRAEAMYRDADEYCRPVDDLVHCHCCQATWTADEWRNANSLIPVKRGEK